VGSRPEFHEALEVVGDPHVSLSPEAQDGASFSQGYLDAKELIRAIRRPYLGIVQVLYQALIKKFQE
jgi:hypothetical protein